MDRKERLKRALSFSSIEFEPTNADMYDEHGRVGLCGQRDKMFYRIESSKFNALIEDVTLNKDCSYITHVNSLLSSGYVPDRISALRKTINATHYKAIKKAEMLLYAEVMVSRLLAYFGCPTVYNEAVSYNTDERQPYYEMVSVDFLEYGQEFTSFHDMDCMFDDELIENVRQIRYEMRCKRYDGYSLETKQKVVEDYVCSYLVRKHIIRDVDFGHNNCGVIEDPSTGRLQYINFDFEYGFGSKMDRLREDLVYCSREFPGVLEKLYGKVCDYRNDFLDLVRDNEIELDNFFHRDIIEEMFYSIDSMYWTMMRMGCRRIDR